MIMDFTLYKVNRRCRSSGRLHQLPANLLEHANFLARLGGSELVQLGTEWRKHAVFARQGGVSIS